MRRRRSARSRRGRRLFAFALALCVLLVLYFTVFQRLMLFLRYPLRERTLIEQTAREYDLEPWHVAAVIFCESSFNRRACSPAGARGLMQLMPDTGEWIARQLGDESYTEDALFDPATNLRYGCWYLRWLLDRYAGDRTLTTAAYHAGPGRVDGWLNNPELSADGARLLSIPYRSTDAYVKRVADASDIYKELYDFDR